MLSKLLYCNIAVCQPVMEMDMFVFGVGRGDVGNIYIELKIFVHAYIALIYFCIHQLLPFREDKEYDCL